MLMPYDRDQWTPKLANLFLKGFRRLNSPISPISREELDLKSDICYAQEHENLNCIFEHSIALLGAGYRQEAEQRFNQYKAQITQKLGPQPEVLWQNLAAQGLRLASLKESARFP